MEYAFGLYEGPAWSCPACMSPQLPVLLLFLCSLVGFWLCTAMHLPLSQASPSCVPRKKTEVSSLPTTLTAVQTRKPLIGAFQTIVFSLILTLHCVPHYTFVFILSQTLKKRQTVQVPLACSHSNHGIAISASYDGVRQPRLPYCSNWKWKTESRLSETS